MSDASQEQVEAAIAETRTMMATAFGVHRKADRQPAMSPFLEEILDAYADAPRCPHLTARPVQPSILVLPFGVWRCRSCTTQHHGKFKEAAGSNALPLGVIEEHTCDRCRRYVGRGTVLTPSVLRQDLWVVVLALCRRCVEVGLADGAFHLEPDPNYKGEQ